MIPMGFGMSTINASVLIWDKATGRQGTLFLDPLVKDTDELMATLQFDWLQPIYTLTFSNGLIACLVLLGIGVLLDVGFVMARPFQSMFIALCAELGTVVIFPLALGDGSLLRRCRGRGDYRGRGRADDSVRGVDPLTRVIRSHYGRCLPVPGTDLRWLSLSHPNARAKAYSRHAHAGRAHPGNQIIGKDHFLCRWRRPCCVCFFRSRRRLFVSLFMGVIIRESKLGNYAEIFSGPVLYGATFFLGLLLGVLCEANTLLNPAVLTLLLLGILALLISGIGGLLGGYVLYFLSGRKFNPVIGIAGVSCVPTTAKVAQKCVAAEAPGVIVLPHALGASISGVITSAILASILISVVRQIQ